jgi:hypothetical protein
MEQKERGSGMSNEQDPVDLVICSLPRISDLPEDRKWEKIEKQMVAYNNRRLRKNRRLGISDVD